MAEAKQLGGPPDRICGHCAGFLDQVLLLDQAAEILLVQPATGQRLDAALQLQQGEGRRHQFEHDRPIFDLGAQPRDAGGEDAAMIGRIGLRRRTRAVLCGARSIASGTSAAS